MGEKNSDSSCEFNIISEIKNEDSSEDFMIKVVSDNKTNTQKPINPVLKKQNENFISQSMESFRSGFVQANKIINFNVNSGRSADSNLDFEKRNETPKKITKEEPKTQFFKRSAVSPQETDNKRPKNTISIQIKDGEDIYYYDMLENDTFEKLYKDLFDLDPLSKLKYKNMNVSKYNTLKSTTYLKDNSTEQKYYFTFTGKINTSVISKPKVEENVILKDTIGVKVNYCAAKSVIVELEKNDLCVKILDLVNEKLGNTDPIQMYKNIIVNGFLVDQKERVDGLFEELDVVDVF